MVNGNSTNSIWLNVTKASMYICVCNAITTTMLKENPELIKKIGSNCGKCLEWLKENKYPGTDIKIEDTDER